MKIKATLFKKKSENNEKYTWYDCTPIDKLGCQWNVLFGQRSNGKTYSLLTMILRKYHDNQEQGAYIRRYLDSIMPNKHGHAFDNIIANGFIADLFKDTKEKWTTCVYNSRKWYLAKTTKGKDGTNRTIVDDIPFMYSIALTEEQDYKGSPFPFVTTIFFDEFISSDGYLFDEFRTFCNVCSTIIRKRNNVKIWLAGNTISQYCPYFAEMGIKHPENIPLGKTRIYTYGSDSQMKLVVQRTENAVPVGKKDIDYYFAFDNPKLKRITKGDWEIPNYPHIDFDYLPKDILYTYFIQFNDETFQCEIVDKDNGAVTYIHRKTTPIKDNDDELIFNTIQNSDERYRRRITKPYDKLGSFIFSFFRKEKVFYQDNSVGDSVSNYLKWCNTL